MWDPFGFPSCSKPCSKALPGTCQNLPGVRTMLGESHIQGRQQNAAHLLKTQGMCFQGLQQALAQAGLSPLFRIFTLFRHLQAFPRMWHNHKKITEKKASAALGVTQGRPCPGTEHAHHLSLYTITCTLLLQGKPPANSSPQMGWNEGLPCTAAN